MDDLISRRAVIDAVHTATYGFICGAEDGDEMTDADKLVLSINKAVCGAIKALPSVPNTFNALSALDCVERQAAIYSIESHIRTGDELYSLTDADKILNHAFEIAASCVYNLPSVQPQRKNGKWETIEGWDGDEIYRCSECGEEYVLIDGTPKENRYHFCPTCGADMRETE